MSAAGHCRAAQVAASDATPAPKLCPALNHPLCDLTFQKQQLAMKHCTDMKLLAVYCKLSQFLLVGGCKIGAYAGPMDHKP